MGSAIGELFSLFSFYTGEPFSRVFRSASLMYSEKPFRVETLQGFPVLDFVEWKSEKSRKIVIFAPGAADEFILVKSFDRDGRAEVFDSISEATLITDWLDLNIEQKVSAGDATAYVPLLFSLVSPASLEFYPVLSPLYLPLDFSKPIYHFAHPFSLAYIKPLLWFYYTRSQIRKFNLLPPAPYPLYERYKRYYLPRGIFFPAYKLRSLTFRGTGKIPYISLMNYTPEPVKFRWLLPENYRNKFYWIKDGRKTHEIIVPPYTKFRELQIEAYIDPGITELREKFIPSVVIMQSRSRIEWLPLPLLRKREEGEFYLKPGEANPKV